MASTTSSTSAAQLTRDSLTEALSEAKANCDALHDEAELSADQVKSSQVLTPHNHRKPNSSCKSKIQSAK
eukprot:CAMPEP_0171837022 /NCGR_PEP_ID=MMETSP0992-20121227/11930_1 /TAXON_ID=483369 /ORGANISM="non described non described, Strain CCMP2098" /LENGTH=69 /DNA_ID=CAMNT_0012453155 /DNA_START=382 /DNA_END=591 /DNA_ORIENTATION=-